MELAYDLCTFFHCLKALLLCHGRFEGEIAGSLANFAVQYGRFGREIVVDTRISHHQVDAVLSRKYIDGCTTTHEVHHHLPSYLLRVGAHSFGHNAVIAGTNTTANNWSWEASIILESSNIYYTGGASTSVRLSGYDMDL